MTKLDGLNKNKIANICTRSYFTVTVIAKSPTFKDYKKLIQKYGNSPKKETTPIGAVSVKKEENDTIISLLMRITVAMEGLEKHWRTQKKPFLSL